MSVAVVGGGIIGLSIASRLVDNGADVTIFDDGEYGAWNVAAGMLAPGGEAAFETPALVRLMSSSAERWSSFAASLGVDVGYDETGTLSLAVTADDVAVAAREWPSPALRPSRLRELEPALSPRVRAGVHRPADCQVDPRRVVAALRERLGDRIVTKRLSTLDEAGAPTVVVAAGCGTAALTGLPIRPVKGQVLRLRGEPGLLRHVIEATVDGRSVYVVPRADGEIVVGATQEERSDWTVTAGGVHDLLRAAIELVPDLAECTLAETLVGHRPGTPDNAPLLGVLREGVVVAAGHFRNGVLLAPVTADLIADLVLTGTTDPMLDDFAPGRFA
ncbi:glycine oxidase ThiO [Actinoplanes sp. NPDC051343]|uniref:glycine oxidase ThiO n=1 Tax=Actinoplanes sp. NPDC051343 TaxID=3363906 RepID=UPI0037A69007